MWLSDRVHIQADKVWTLSKTLQYFDFDHLLVGETYELIVLSI